MVGNKRKSQPQRSEEQPHEKHRAHDEVVDEDMRNEPMPLSHAHIQLLAAALLTNSEHEC